MSGPNDFRRLGAVALSLLVMTACADAADPVALGPDQAAMASSGPVLVECPTDTAASTTGTIGVTGGSVRLANHELSLPSLALQLPQEFLVAAPVSNYMELQVKAADQDSFEFERTGSITIDYSRCSRSNIDKAALSVWQIDPETKELLEYMGGVDDKEARTVTFQTDHLSTFSIAH